MNLHKTNHPILDRIHQEVSHLTSPALGSLQALWQERMDEHHAKLTELTLRQEEIRERGFNAAIRLMTTGLPLPGTHTRSYFEEITHEGGKP